MKNVPFYPRAVTTALFLCVTLSAWAQPGVSEFYQVAGEVDRWYYSVSDLVLAIGAVTGIIGGLRVYANWQGGKHHIDAQVMGWFFSCLFLSLIGVAIKAFFGR